MTIKTIREKAREVQGRVIPYAIAWFLGVPLFILVIIRLIRGH